MTYPKVSTVKIATFFGVYHARNLKTSQSVTGVMIILNINPIQWYRKSQNYVKASNFVSELLAIKITTELTMTMCYNIIMIGLPVYVPS